MKALSKKNRLIIENMSASELESETERQLKRQRKLNDLLQYLLNEHDSRERDSGDLASHEGLSLEYFYHYPLTTDSLTEESYRECSVQESSIRESSIREKEDGPDEGQSAEGQSAEGQSVKTPVETVPVETVPVETVPLEDYNYLLWAFRSSVIRSRGIDVGCGTKEIQCYCAWCGGEWSPGEEEHHRRLADTQRTLSWKPCLAERCPDYKEPSTGRLFSGKS